MSDQQLAQLAKIEQQLVSHEQLDNTRFDSLRHEFNALTQNHSIEHNKLSDAIVDIRIAVQQVDKRVAYFSGGLAAMIALMEIGFRAFS